MRCISVSKHVYTHYIFKCSPWPYSYMASITWRQNLPVNSHLGSRKNGIGKKMGDVDNIEGLMLPCYPQRNSLKWFSWSGDPRWLSSVSKPRSLHLPWLSVNMLRPPLTLKGTESLLGHSPIGAAKSTKLKLSPLVHVWLHLSNMDIKKQQRSSFENYAHLYFNIWLILLQADWELLDGRGCEVLRVKTALVIGTKHLAVVWLS